jgi:hypothetical protein
MKNKLSKNVAVTILLLFLTLQLPMLPVAAGNAPLVSFGKVKKFAVGFNAFSVVVGDFNGDGKLDLVMWSYLSEKISILLGVGDGTFQPAEKFAVGTKPFSVAVGDFNGDEISDLALANQSGNISIFWAWATGPLSRPGNLPQGGSLSI